MGNCKTKQGTSLHYKYKQQDLTKGNELYKVSLTEAFVVVIFFIISMFCIVRLSNYFPGNTFTEHKQSK
jgi:hypothetical protein